MKVLPESIFSEFEGGIFNETYYPTHPIETLKARLTATWLLQNSQPAIRIKAINFIIKTSSTFKEEVLSRLQKLASQIKTWDELQLCSSYDNTLGTFLEYKLFFTNLNGKKQVIHYYARYESKDDHCCFVSETLPIIRVTGDPILQKEGILFPETPTHKQEQELAYQIELAKSVLIQTGGAGIAANQCAAIKKPYCFTIVGVFHEIPQHVIGVEKRYPGIKFPEAKIMLNPVVTYVSQETQQFNHACLSVPCANRCAVMSPIEMHVRYQDPLDDMMVKEDKFTGTDAVVLWHELTHIVSGKTYMDVTFESLCREDLLQFQKMLTDEIERRREDYSHIAELTVPPFYYSVKMTEEGIAQLDATELALVLPKMSEDVLFGLLNQINKVFSGSHLQLQ